MEIEIKSLLTRDKYEELKGILPARFRLINSDSITTVKFRPDVRVRYSDKLNEVVFKDGDPTHYARNEICINLGGRDDCLNMVRMFRSLGMEEEPSWKKHKQEFVLARDGNEYTLSLQHIENFAYILEAEIMSDDAEKHIPILKDILEDLGCEPIEPADFKARINDYIRKNSKK
jgi:adenylate cyclase class IV